MENKGANFGLASMDRHELSEMFTTANILYNMTNDNQTLNLQSESEKAFGVISYVLGTLIAVINIVSLVCLIRYRRHVSGTGFWHQLLFICFTDILSGIGISLFYFGSIFSFIHSSIYQSSCVTGLVIFPISTTLSFGNCCIVSVQRYIAMKKITKTIITYDKRKTIYMILLNILLSIVTFVSSVMVVVIRFGFKFEDFCEHINKSGQNEYKSHFVPGTLIMSAVFTLATNFLSFLSIFELANAKRELSSLSTGFNASSNLTIQHREFHHASKTFLFIVLVLNVTSIPTLIFIPVLMKFDIELSPETVEILSRFATLNSLLNPFVYLSRMRNFRKALYNDLKTLFCV